MKQISTLTVGLLITNLAGVSHACTTVLDSDDPKSTAPRKTLGWSVSPDLKNSEDTTGWSTLVLDEAK
ncbi:MAG: hypothetical protein O2923_14515 [Verrucomicrobia bacterium]|nr:hypothetical protein [Verrucomicrobiota bacterium]